MEQSMKADISRWVGNGGNGNGEICGGVKHEV